MPGAFLETSASGRRRFARIRRALDERHHEEVHPAPGRESTSSGGKHYVPDGTPGHHSPYARRFIDILQADMKADYLTFGSLVEGLGNLAPEPHYGDWGKHDKNSDFVFLGKSFR